MIYHGHEITSTLDDAGWHHVLQAPDGEVINQYSELADAIREAKRRSREKPTQETEGE